MSDRGGHDAPSVHGADDARAEEIFSRIVDLAPHERTQQLERLATDPGLRRRVERFLEWDRNVPGGFLASEEPPARVAPDARIGPYHVLERLGEGGMGTVYAARQTFPQRDVALKVMRSGRATEETLRRFRYEIDVLGRLQHVGIARIYDAGVAKTEDASGLVREVPYFTMELVRGVPLLTYARERGLDTPARIELLARVADAVHYAHQHGIIHRDLKSENVLVTTEESTASADAGPVVIGQPKILDFGIARAVEAEGVRSETLEGALVGSLSCMSPEQVAGNNALVDVRSDVYALGVMLYELLAGRPPLELSGQTVPRAVRRILEETPRALDEVHPELRGDLTVVASRALEKDPGRRYASALDLATDLRRYLRGEPIGARADSRLYLLHRSLRRHRLAIAVALAFVVLACAFAFTSVQQARHSRELAAREAAARRLADADFERAMEAVELLTRVATDDLSEVPRASQARGKILEASLDFYRGLIEAHGPSSELRSRGTQAALRVGHVLDDLGQEAEARQALTVVVAELEDAAPDTEQAVDLAVAHARLANALAEDGELVAAEEQSRKAMALLLAAEESGDPKDAGDPGVLGARARALAYTSRNLATILTSTGRHGEALAAVDTALDPMERAHAASPSTANRAELLRLLDRCASTQLEAGRDESVETCLERACELGEELVAEFPGSATFLSDLVGTLTNRGTYLGRRGRGAEMRRDFERAVELGERLVEDNPDLVDRLEVYVLACNNLATVRAAEGRFDETLALLERARDLQQRVASRAPSAQRVGELGFVEANLASMLIDLERYAEADAALVAAAEHLDEGLRGLPDRARFVTARQFVQASRARIHLADGGHSAAARALAPLDASREWQLVELVLATYADTVELAGADTAAGESCLDAAARFLERSLAAGLEAPPRLVDPGAFGTLLEHPGFATAAEAAVRR